MAINGDKEAAERRKRRIVAYSVSALLLFIAVILTAPMTECSSYRKRAIKAAPLSDLRYAAICQEDYYVDNEIYADSIKTLEENCSSFSPSNSVVIRVVSADKRHFKMEAYHEKGEHLYEITGTDHRPTIIRYEWKNQTKGAGTVMY